jgi:small-conductance mechanosensitive channel
MEIETNKRLEEKKKHVTATKTKHKVWIGSYFILALLCLCLHFIIRFNIWDHWVNGKTIVQRGSLAGFFIFLVLAVSKYIQSLVIKYNHLKSIAYNLVRLIQAIAVLTICMIIIAFLFENWYTTAVSLGLFSLILGFALQTPISSFIGWLYIIVRKPYRVGDRIQLGDFKGDVVEIGYLDTTLWEFSGDYLTNDLPSGQLIRFPNTVVLQSEVYNYSWREFSYIWNEIPFHVAYESDFDYVIRVLKDITKDVLGPDMENKVNELKQLVEQTAIDELTIREYPFVTLRINANTWVEASVNYLVDPKKAAAVRTEIISKAIPALLKEPDKVMFPKSNSR